MKTPEPREQTSLAERQRDMKFRMRKARCNRRFTLQEESQMRWLRKRGWTLKQIADLYGCTDAGVFYIVKRKVTH